jgi:hypothetical protein
MQIDNIKFSPLSLHLDRAIVETETARVDAPDFEATVYGQVEYEILLPRLQINIANDL